ncbi:unnamed protein product [marine sediment metagenome]|uniref:Uncharacterized protein n=1 Tax=marine sediment metagenome TaxID=412755 RepID=X1USL1_9ZZZZ
MIQKTTLGLSEFLSTLSGYAQVPELKAGVNVFLGEEDTTFCQEEVSSSFFLST